MTPSSQGGTPDPQELYDNLVLVVAKEPPKGSLVLIDDARSLGTCFIQPEIVRSDPSKPSMRSSP
jgi:hypothetical protein